MDMPIFKAKVAERVGFEPTVELTPYNGFRVMNNRIVRTHTEPLPLNAIQILAGAESLRASATFA